MNIYVLNKQLDIVAVVDAYKSIIWTNRYYECGDFELYLSATPSLIYDLREDYILVREDREDNGMVIENIKIKTDVEEGNYLTVSGRCLKSILYRRIIWEQTQVKADIEECISILIDKNIINPVDTNRKIENVKLGNMIATKTELSAQYTGDNLGETITSICQSFGLGWDISLNMEQKTFTFTLNSGVDRSYNQKENPWVIFSSEYDNLLSTEYTFSKQNYGNVTKVAGEGEGLARKYTTVGNASGLERYEIYTDARDISTNDGQVTEEQYNEQLTEKGKEQLAESVKTENFSGEVLQYQHEYEKDYFLGDIVEVVNEYEMSAVSRIIEVIESEDESGNYTIPTFSTWEGFSITEPKEERESHLFVPPPQVIEPPEPPEATTVRCIYSGKEFNSKIKSLAAKSYKDFDNDDKVITAIEVTETKPDESIETRELSNTENNQVLTAYMDGTVLKLYTEADIIILPKDSSYMFYSLKNIASLDLSRFSSIETQNMERMFCGLANLTMLNLGKNFDTSNTTNMSYMFNELSSMYSLSLGEKFDTSNVTKMNSMFSYMGNSDSNLYGTFLLDLGKKFDTSKVTDMSYMFAYVATWSTNTTLILGEKFDTSNVKNMSYMFVGAFVISGKKFETDIKNLSLKSATNITNMFYSFGPSISYYDGNLGLIYSLEAEIKIDLGDEFVVTDNMTLGNYALSPRDGIILKVPQSTYDWINKNLGGWISNLEVR